MYVEGNLETRIYDDLNSQVKRIREIAVRSNGTPLVSHVYSVPSYHLQ